MAHFNCCHESPNLILHVSKCATHNINNNAHAVDTMNGVSASKYVLCFDWRGRGMPTSDLIVLRSTLKETVEVKIHMKNNGAPFAVRPQRFKLRAGDVVEVVFVQGGHSKDIASSGEFRIDTVAYHGSLRNSSSTKIRSSLYISSTLSNITTTTTTTSGGARSCE